MFTVLLLPCLFSKFVCPIFPFKSIFSFSIHSLQSSSLCLSASICHSTPLLFDIFAITTPYSVGNIQKYLVGGGGQEGHAGEEFKFSYQKRPDFFSCFDIKCLLMEDVLGCCMESLFWEAQILPLTFPSLAPQLFFSYLFAESKSPSSSSCHLCMRAFQSD